MRGLYVEQQSIGSSLRTRLAVYRLYVEDCFYVYLSLSTSIQHQPFFSFLFWFNSRKCVLTFMYFLRYFLYPLAEPHSTSLRSDSITPIKEIIFPVWMEDTGWTCYTAAEKYIGPCVKFTLPCWRLLNPKAYIITKLFGYLVFCLPSLYICKNLRYYNIQNIC
jgi:hypothetical protein